MQATAALNLNSKATTKVADSTAKSTTSSVSAEKKGEFDKSLTKASGAVTSEGSKGSVKKEQPQSSNETSKIDAKSSVSDDSSVSASDSKKTDKASSDSLFDSLFGSDEGETPAEDEVVAKDSSATGKVKSESKQKPEDVDDNMQEASDLLKRLDESNAALQSEKGDPESARTGKKPSSTENQDQVTSFRNSDAQRANGSNASVDSDGNLTKAQSMTQSSEAKVVDSEHSVKQTSKPVNDVSSTKQSDTELSSKPDAAKAQESDATSQIKKANNQADIDTEQGITGSAKNKVEQSSGQVSGEEPLDSESKGVYGQSSGEDNIVWDETENSAVTTTSAASTQKTPAQVAGAGSAAQATQSTSTVSSAAAGHNATASTPLSSAGNPQMAQAAAVTGQTSPAATAGAQMDGSNHHAALAAAGLQASKNQKQDTGQPESTPGSEPVSAAQTQNNLSGLQRLEQAQQAQAPVQIKSELAADQMAERVQMMMSKNLKNIDIRLDPPELGRMQIRMNMNGDLANVQITVSNPAARDLIEQTMPRLREMLAQNGVALAEASVQQQSSRGGQAQQGADQQRGSGGQFAGSQGSGIEGGVEDEPTIQVSTSSPEQGISYFA
jgi:flagellar hook-length control protein FliK